MTGAVTISAADYRIKPADQKAGGE